MVKKLRKGFVIGGLAATLLFSSLAILGQSSVLWNTQQDVAIGANDSATATSDATKGTLPSGQMILTTWRGYSSFRNMANASTDIVMGTVIDQTNGPPAALPMIASEIRIETVLKGDLKPSTTIIVEQVGLFKDGTTTTLDEPLMVKGGQYVLFLEYVSETGHYGSVAGPEGLYTIENLKANSMVLSAPIKVRNVSLDAFLPSITSAIQAGPEEEPPEEVPYPEQGGTTQ